MLNSLNLIIILYLAFSILSPLLYSREFETEKLSRNVSVEDVETVSASFNKYIEAVLSEDKESIKYMLPFIKRFSLNSYDELFSMNSEKDIINVDQYLIYDISAINNNTFEVSFYAKTGNLIDGLQKGVIVVKLNRVNSSFKILYDKNLIQEGE